MIRTFVLAFGVLTLAACQPSERMKSQWAVMQQEQEMQLASAGERWQQAYQAQDWEKLRSLYTDDAVLMTQGRDKIIGADNIITFLRRLPDAGATVEFRFENEDVDAGGRYTHVHGFVTAKYMMTIAFPGQGPVKAVGRSLLIYKWQDGDWKLWRDMDNTASDVTVDDFTP